MHDTSQSVKDTFRFKTLIIYMTVLEIIILNSLIYCLLIIKGRWACIILMKRFTFRGIISESPMELKLK